MWKRMCPLLVLFSVAMNVAFGAVWLAHALHGPPDAAGVGPGQPSESAIWHPLYRELDLTEQQWEKIEPGLTDLMDASQALCEKCRQARRGILELIEADEPDLQAIRGKQAEILDVQHNMQSMIIEHILAERQILTPEQRVRLFQLIRQRTGGQCRGNLMQTGQCSGKCSGCASGQASED